MGARAIGCARSSSRLHLATPPRTQRAICCVNNERRCRFVRWVRFGFSSVGQAREISSAPCGASPRGRLKNLSTGEIWQQTAFSIRGAGEGCMAPDFGDRVRISRRLARALPCPSLRPCRPEAAGNSLRPADLQPAPRTPSRHPMSILRSILATLLDERRCHRAESQCCRPRPAARASQNARYRALGTSCRPDRQSADGLNPTSLLRAICLRLPASCRGSGNCSFRSWSSSSTKC